MRQLKVLKFLQVWRKKEDDAQSKETDALLPKVNVDSRTKTISSLSNGELLHDGKIWEDEPALVQGGRVEPWSCDYLLKLLLLLGNLLLSALGLGVAALGVWGLGEKGSLGQERLGQVGSDPMLLLLCVGLALALLCLAGCVGTFRENACLLQLYSTALLVLLSAQILLAIVAFSLYSQIPAYLRSIMLLAIARYNDDLDLHFLTDELQTGLQCCGADSYRDWDNNMYFNCSAPGVLACGVPPSCCMDPLENGTVWNSLCGVGVRRLDEFSAGMVVFLGGCLGAVSRWVERNSGSLAVAGVALLGGQVLALFIATRLLDQIKRSQSQF